MEAVLISMGYRQFKPGFWAKPVGYHLFVVQFIDNEWQFSNLFKGIDEVKIHCYERKNVADLDELKSAEAHTKMVLNGIPSRFEFTNPGDLL